MQYQIKVKGHLDTSLADSFDSLTISNLDEGDALLSGLLPDQAALQSILKRVIDLGLTLLSVNSVLGEEKKDLEKQDKHEANNGESEISE